MTVTVRLMYSCARCAVKRASLEVPAREAGQDLIAWMDATVLLIAADHRQRHPDCREDRLTELLIPQTGSDRLGGPIVN